MNIAIITGASCGLGREFAMQIDRLSARLDEIWLIARRKEPLEAASSMIQTKTRVLPMDVTSEEDIKGIQRLMDENDVTVRILVNSAGYGIIGSFHKGELYEQLGMVDLNCRALTQMDVYLSAVYEKTRKNIKFGVNSRVYSAGGFCGLCGYEILRSKFLESNFGRITRV